MKYVCLVYLVENDMSAMTKKEADACTDESLAYDHALRKAGHLIVAHALQPVESATTVRVRNGKLFATDGPFAETREQLGGFFLIDAANLDEALDIATKIPAGRWGTVEVRPVLEISGLPS